jgi:6-phosphofructokinase
VCIDQFQRGGKPTSFDLAFCSMFGAGALGLLAARDYSNMVWFGEFQLDLTAIPDVVGRLKTVPWMAGY